MALGSRLKDIRKEWKLSQKGMAEKVGIATSTYQYYERGERDIPSEVLIKLTSFGVESEWLLTGAGVPFKGERENGSSSGRSAKVFGFDQADQFRHFRDKQRAQDATLDLLALERLDRAVFIEACAYIKGMVGGLQAADKGLNYTGPERRSGDRRKANAPDFDPANERRSGQDRRKAVGES